MTPLQKSVAAFTRRHRLDTDVAHRILDAVSELGEVAKEALKGSSYGHAKFAPTAAWNDELGDVFFSLLCVANSTGVDLDRAVEQALAKYEARLSKSGSASSSRGQGRKAPRRKRAGQLGPRQDH